MDYAHWGLARSPFARTAAAAFFYEGESQSEALARLRFIAPRGQSALLLGESGVGKTLLVSRFAEASRRDARDVALVNVASLSPQELLWQVAAQLSLGPRPTDSQQQLFRRLADFAAAGRWRAAPAILIVDDADEAGPDVRMQLLRIATLSQTGPPWLSLVYAAKPAGVSRLGQPLLESIDLGVRLEPWSEGEMVGHLQHALVEAGCDRPVFDDGALSAIYTLTGGVPRDVNRLADHALLGAAAEGLETIPAATIEAACDELAWAIAR